MDEWDIDWSWARARPELGKREALLDLKRKGEKFLAENPDPYERPKLTWWQAFVKGFTSILWPPEPEPPPTAEDLVKGALLRTQRAWAKAMITVCDDYLEADNG